jgi:outer membrane protein OmpA-like peptidoglycan-associated protein
MVPARMKARKARPPIPAIRRAAALVALCAAGALPVSAASQERAASPAGEVLIDPTVLDQLGRDPYGRPGQPPSPAQQQRKPQLKPPAKATAPKTAPAAPGPQSRLPQEWAPPPYATLPPGGLLPPPGPGELERRQAEINAALGRVAPAPAQQSPQAAAVSPAAKQPAKPAAAKKPASAPVAKAPSAAPVAPVTAAPATATPAYRLPQFQQPATQVPAGPAPAVPPLPGSAAAAVTPEPPPMAPPTPPPQGFAAPDRPSLAPVAAPTAPPPPASVPLAAAPVAIAPQGKAPAAQTSAPPPAATRAAAPAPAPAAQAPPRAPQAEPAFVPAGRTAARVGFLAGSSDLPENAKTQLKAVADQMNRDGEMRVQLLAYAGPREDTASQTRRLSLFRALAVRSYLIEQGIRSTRMDVRAMGNKFDEEPADRVDVVVADR